MPQRLLLLLYHLSSSFLSLSLSLSLSSSSLFLLSCAGDRRADPLWQLHLAVSADLPALDGIDFSQAVPHWPPERRSADTVVEPRYTTNIQQKQHEEEGVGAATRKKKTGRNEESEAEEKVAGSRSIHWNNEKDNGQTKKMDAGLREGQCK